MKAHIVTLNPHGGVRPSYGPFLWSPEYDRYVFRGEFAVTAGQLADLFTQAAAFLQRQRNYHLVLSAMEVEIAGTEESATQTVEPEPPDWLSQKEALLSSVKELQDVIRILKQPAKRRKLVPIE